MELCVLRVLFRAAHALFQALQSRIEAQVVLHGGFAQRLNLLPQGRDVGVRMAFALLQAQPHLHHVALMFRPYFQQGNGERQAENTDDSNNRY